METVKVKRNLLPQEHWAELIEGAYWGSDTGGTTNTLMLPDWSKVFVDRHNIAPSEWQIWFFVATDRRSKHTYTGTLADAKHWAETMIVTGAI